MKKKIFTLFTKQWFGYFVAVMLVILATWLKYLAQPDIIPAEVPILYILAIVLTATFFGLLPSLLCCALSTLAFVYFFLTPLYTFPFYPQILPVSLVFFITGIIISYLSESLRKKIAEAKKEVSLRKEREAELIAYRENLEALVKQRTSELEKINKDLIKEIEEHQKDEDALKESEERFRIMADSSPLMIAVHDADGGIRFVNHAYREFFGVKQQDVQGKNWKPLIHPADEERYTRQFLISIKQQKPFHEQARVQCADGQWCWVESFGVPRFSSNGKFLGIVISALDITARKKIEDALIESENLLSTFFESPGAMRGIVEIIDDNTVRYVTANSWTARIYSLDPAGLRNKLSSELNIPLDIVHMWISHYRQSMETGKPVTYNYQALIGGKKTWFASTVSYLKNLVSQYPRFAFVTMDITERVKAERVKDEFISLVSHELRTPMMVVLGSLKTAQTEGVSQEDREILFQNALEGAESLSALLENLLELSRYQAGRLKIEKESVNISDITRSVANSFRTLGETHSIIVECPESLPRVEADSMRVGRILHNLISNAVKYSPPYTTIRISAREENDKVITSVADEGPGMKPEEQQKIFEPFERSENVINTKGLGLGLVVCKRLVEAHGGKIWIESNRSQGSTFYFTLPVKKGGSSIER